MRIKVMLPVYLAACGLSFAATPAPVTLSPEEKKTSEMLAKRLEWFQDMRFGLMIHWGIYSQWGCIESWPLVPEDKWARPDDLKPWMDAGKDIDVFKRNYFALNKTFNPVSFDPHKWAMAAKQAGMKYVVFTTKHHDGFSMFDTKQTDFRVTHSDCPYSHSRQPDIARDVFNAFRDEGFGIGAYFSKPDWHSPYYWAPDLPVKNRNPNYDTLAQPERWGKFREFVYNQIEELMSNYGQIDILWLDGGQVRPPKQDIQMEKIATMARSHQPELIIVDRTVGGKYENYLTPEQQVPDQPLSSVWESCLTMGNQWSYKPDDNYKTPRQLIHLLVDVVAKGGNLLLNVGPEPDGELPPEALRLLKEIGNWMAINGEAIYGTRPIKPYKEGRVCFTRKGQTLYAIYMLENDQCTPPAEIVLPKLPLEKDATIQMLGVRSTLSYKIDGSSIKVEVPVPVTQTPPCGHAYVLKTTLQK